MKKASKSKKDIVSARIMFCIAILTALIVVGVIVYFNQNKDVKNTSETITETQKNDFKAVESVKSDKITVKEFVDKIEDGVYILTFDKIQFSKDSVEVLDSLTKDYKEIEISEKNITEDDYYLLNSILATELNGTGGQLFVPMLFIVKDRAVAKSHIFIPNNENMSEEYKLTEENKAELNKIYKEILGDN